MLSDVLYQFLIKITIKKYYYKTFLEKYYFQLVKKITTATYFDSIIMLRFNKTKIAKNNFMVQKKN